MLSVAYLRGAAVRSARSGAALLMLVGGLPMAAADRSQPTAPPPPDASPVLRIAVDRLGYLPPPATMLTYRVPSSTIDFIDSEHLLFTFHASKLMRRMPNEPDDDQDQTIHAVVLDLAAARDAEGRVLSAGRVSGEADWRMHDRNRYLWRLPNGRFLVRSRNTLYEIDAGLHFTPYVRTEREMTDVGLSADGTLLSVESLSSKAVDPVEDAVPDANANSAMLGTVARERGHSVEVSIIHTADDKVAFHTEAPVNVHLMLMHDGYLGARQQESRGNRAEWAISYYPFRGEPRAFAKVLSSCRPRLTALNSDVVLVTSCTRDSDDHLEQAFSLDGRTLWEQRWSARYVMPTIEFSQNGSRFAVASLELTHPVGVLDAIDDTLIRRQLVGVYDTETGQLRLVKDASPMLPAGQNFALSADGQRFAVLRDGAIEVYNLPPAAVD